MTELDKIKKSILDDSSKWEWSIDSDGNPVKPEYGCDDLYVKVSKMPYHIMKSLGKTTLTKEEYEK